MYTRTIPNKINNVIISCFLPKYTQIQIDRYFIKYLPIQLQFLILKVK